MKKKKFKKNKPVYSKKDKEKTIINYKLIIIAILITIVFSAAIAIKNRNIHNYQDTPAQGIINVIDSTNSVPENNPVEKGKSDSVHSPANPEKPATIEDLGGSRLAPGNIDQLLKDKNIEVNK